MKIWIRLVAGAACLAGMLWMSHSADGGRFGGGFRGSFGGSFGGGLGDRFGGSFGGLGGDSRLGNLGGGTPLSRPAFSGTGAFASLGASGHGPLGGSFSGIKQDGAFSGSLSSGAGQRGVGVYTGPRGGVAVGGDRSGTITAPEGRTVSGGESGGAVIGPKGNVYAGGSKDVVAKGPNGAAVAGSKSSFAAGSGGVVAKGGAVAGGVRVDGGAVAAHHGAVAVGPHGAVAAGGGFVAHRDVAGGAFVGTRYISAGTMSTRGVAIRRNFGYYGSFTPTWFARYPGAWVAAGWTAADAWRAATWAFCAPFVGFASDASAIYYNYGSNVTYQDGNVCYDGKVDATQAQYAQQATQIAEAGAKAKPPEDEKWQSLGVFAMTMGNETTSNDIFQLAINKDGIVRGNYYNAMSDTTTPVYGSLDKKSQRLAWTIGDKKTPVYETGLYNLTLAQTTVLAHFSADRTSQFNLFRIEQNKDDKGGGK